MTTAKRTTRSDPTHQVRIRALDPGDREAMEEFLAGLSEPSRRLRFLGPLPRVPVVLVDRLVDVDGHDHAAWGAFAGDRLVGEARFVRLPHDPATAELAVSVADDHRRQGLGTRLVEQVTAVAMRSGVGALVSTVAPDNAPARALLAATGVRTRFEDGLLVAVRPLMSSAGVAA